MERPTCKKEERVRWREAVILESAFSIRIIEKNDRSLGPIGFLVIIIMYFFFSFADCQNGSSLPEPSIVFFFIFPGETVFLRNREPGENKMQRGR